MVNSICFITTVANKITGTEESKIISRTKTDKKTNIETKQAGRT